MLNNSINIGSTPIKDLNNIAGYNRAFTSQIPSIDRSLDQIVEVNIKDEKAKEKEKMLELINKRQQEILESNKIKVTPMEENIAKLKSILSKRFNLEEDDYKILVDRYHIARDGINKTNLEEILSYIKQTSKFKNNTLSMGEDNLKLKESGAKLSDMDKLEEERRIQLEQMKKNIEENKQKRIQQENPNIISPIVYKPAQEIVVNRVEEQPIYVNPVSTSKSQSNSILCISSLTNIIPTKDGIYEVPIWIDDLEQLKNKKKCRLVSCEIEKELYKKHMEQFPYILVNIEECQGQIYINGTTKKLVERVKFKEEATVYYGEGSRELNIKQLNQLKKFTISFHDSMGQVLFLEKGQCSISIEIY